MSQIGLQVAEQLGTLLGKNGDVCYKAFCLSQQTRQIHTHTHTDANGRFTLMCTPGVLTTNFYDP